MYKRDGTPDFYLVKGITDFRCGINRLSEIIRDQQTVNVFDNAAFIFTCKKKDQIKILYWGGAGFWLIAYRLEQGKFRWLKEKGGLEKITKEQLIWLLNGLEINPKNLIKELKTSLEI